jgi:hypothetical protein
VDVVQSADKGIEPALQTPAGCCPPGENVGTEAICLRLCLGMPKEEDDD